MFKLSPKEIKNQEFKKILRGYDPFEVDTFLEMVTEEFEQIVKTNKELEGKLKETEEKLKDLETEKEQTDAHIHKSELKDQIEVFKERALQDDLSVEEEKKDAVFIIKEAEIKAEQIISDGKKEFKKVLNDIEMLKDQKKLFVNRMKKILKSEFELIKVLETEGETIGVKIEPAAEFKEENNTSTDSKDQQPEQKAETAAEIPEYAKPADTVIEEQSAETQDEDTETETHEAVETEIPVNEETTPEPPVEKTNIQQYKKSEEDNEAEPKTQKNKTEKPHTTGIQDGFNLIDRIVEEDESTNGDIENS